MVLQVNKTDIENRCDIINSYLINTTVPTYLVNYLKFLHSN